MTETTKGLQVEYTRAVNGIKKMIQKDHLAICELSDYACGVTKFFSKKEGGYCGSQRCKDKLLNDIITMGEEG